MAIGLNDLAAKKQTKKVEAHPAVVAIENTDIVTTEEVMEKQQRPWEGKLQAQKSSVASLAVKRAREISAKNELHAKELRKNFTSAQKELEVNQYIENREKEFMDLDSSKQMLKTKNRIRTQRSLFKRLRDSIFRS
ncbi:hypothetical protein M902_2298 [Bacteriovorax sp. BAL6_X]|uniref:hypothetical protein n=1 Tax=Bacteriovorax sp. BAL6_X TaxID=1201290 RepID=UPI000385875D|nr:hypothetical protein [Bacteriovorax sp. BAL6_X]EPZ51919.1 hypothetical protein M902_2298 [Bacteriovorax sp. BAL6_X]